MKIALANRANVDPTLVDVTVYAGSIIAECTIQTLTDRSASLQSTMASALSSTTSATNMFAGVTIAGGASVSVLAVVTQPFVTAIAPSPAPPPPPPLGPAVTTDTSSKSTPVLAVAADTTDTSSNTVLLIVVPVIVVLVLALVAGGIIYHRRHRSAATVTRRARRRGDAGSEILLS